MKRSWFCSSFAALAAATGTGRRPATAAGQLHAAAAPIDADAQLFYAEALGLFQKHGLDVDVTTNAKGSAVLAAVVGGSLDIGEANSVSAITAYKHGVGLTCISATSYYTNKAPSTVLMALQGSPIRAARDLTGRSVGVNSLRDLTQLATMQWIDKNGGDSTKVRFIELGFPQMLPALQQNRVDAAVIANPGIAAAEKVARIVAAPYDAVAERFPVACFLTATTFARQNPATVAKVIDTLREAGAWANAHRSESGAILGKVTAIEPAVIATMPRVVYPEQRLEPADLQPVIDLCARYGVIDARFPAREIVWSG